MRALFILVGTFLGLFIAPPGEAAPEEGEPVSITAGMAHGGFSDRIALDVPPAPNGAGPSVALMANHAVTDGAVGSGWVLEATSVIVRRTEGGGYQA